MQNNKLQFCANISLLFNELPIEQRFAAAKAAGFNTVEIQFPYDIPLPKLLELKNTHDLNIILINVAAGDLMQGGEGLASVPHKQQEFDEALTQCIEYAKALNVQCVNVLPGRCVDAAKRATYLTTFLHNVKKAADALHGINVKCTFEAINTIDMPNFLIHHTQQMLDIINKAQHPNLFMQYDIYHMTKMNEAVCDDVKKYSDKIGHIQFADCPNRGEPGTGNINFEQLFNAIACSEYNGWVGAEYKPTKPTIDTLNWYQ